MLKQVSGESTVTGGELSVCWLWSFESSIGVEGGEKQNEREKERAAVEKTMATCSAPRSAKDHTLSRVSHATPPILTYMTRLRLHNGTIEPGLGNTYPAYSKINVAGPG
jgi:hypothetical protein